jgi:hypothetical protein
LDRAFQCGDGGEGLAGLVPIRLVLADTLDVLRCCRMRRGIARSAGPALFGGPRRGTGTILFESAYSSKLGEGRDGSEPQSQMMAIATLALAVNVCPASPTIRGESASSCDRICTRADVVANAGVIGSGLLLAVTGWRYADLIVGTSIGLYVIKEAIEILREAREAAQITVSTQESNQ